MKSLAFTAFLLAACGDDGVHHLADAPPAPDGTVVDAAPAQVSVLVTDNKVPVADATVYFQGPDSSLVTSAMTGVDGTARAVMPAGGFVTVISPRPSAFGVIVISDRLSTFAGVKPGDELHLELATDRPITSVTIDVIVPDDPGAARYDLYTTCGQAQLTTTTPPTPTQVFLAGCAGVADMLVVTFDANGQPLRSLYRPAQPVSNGASIVLTGTYVNMAPMALSVTASPAWVGSYNAELVLASARGPLFSGYGSLEVAGPPVSIAMPVAAGTTIAQRTHVYPVQPAIQRQTILDWGLPLADHTVNAGATLLRPFETRPTFDPATRTVAWTEGTGKAADLVRVEYSTYRDGVPAHAWTWQMVAPAGTSAQVTFPILQGDAAAAFTTVETDSFGVGELETVAIAGGYDGIRAHALAQRLDAVPPGATGQLTYQQLYEQVSRVRPTLRPSATFTRATR